MHIPDYLVMWLNVAKRHPSTASMLFLQGSLLLKAICIDGRIPEDVDYLVAGAFDPIAAHNLAREIQDLSEGQEDLKLIGTEVIYDYTEFPGLRAYFRQSRHSREKLFKVDFAYGDPLAEPAIQVDINGVGATTSVTLETLFGWKLHALIQWGSAHWRPKDLYDLDVMWSSGKLRPASLIKTIPVAFHSRNATYWDLARSFLDYRWGYLPEDTAKWDNFCRDAGVTIRYTDIRHRFIQNMHKISLPWHADESPFFDEEHLDK